MSPLRKVVVVGCVCLIAGVLIGWYSGRFMLERYWTQPLVLKRLAEADVQRSSAPGADPSPPVGAVVLGPAPLARARMVLAEITAQDPVVMTLGDVGTGNEGSQLNLELKNRAKCAVVELSGVAYGYDAYGQASRMNQGGEHYVAFSEKNVTGLAPASTHVLSLKLHHSETASLVLAQVDRMACSDGTRWSRN
jgi:hypothetical protein